jgi:DNA-binding NtrC family response regulator
VRSAETELEGHPDVVLVDVWLPDGSGQRVIERAVRLRPAPAVIAMSGHASAEEAFELARAGARRYLAKPIALEDLMRSIDEALADRPDLSPMVAAHVGHTPLREVIDQVRDTMFEEALARKGGSRTGAAKVLGVTRQAVQQVARERARTDDSDPSGGRGA